MRPRQLAGEIIRARAVFLYVDYGPDVDATLWLEISKAKAKEIVDDARESKIDEIAAHVAAHEVFIGDPDDFPPEDTTPEDPQDADDPDDDVEPDDDDQ